MSGLNERLKESLEKKGMSQRELANAIGCTEAAVSHYLKGDRIPRTSVLNKIALALGTTIDYLLDGIPVDSTSEVSYAKKLIARNADQLTNSDKKEIIALLMGGDDA
jgi:transcriptional regulator with XRE-family HTH domain